MNRISLSLLVTILASFNAIAGDVFLENGLIRVSVDSSGVITVVDQRSATEWKQAIPDDGEVYSVNGLSMKGRSIISSVPANVWTI